MKQSLKKNVAVFFGGRSCEHDISIITGVLALNCLDREKFRPYPVYITEDGAYTGERLMNLTCYKSFDVAGLKRVTVPFNGGVLREEGRRHGAKSVDIHCAINCCHGLNGEDGSIDGMLRLAGIANASPGLLASSVCMDKVASKIFFKGLGLNVLDYAVVHGRSFFSSRQLSIELVERKVGYPCIIKPARLGSSIGIYTAKNREELEGGITSALRYDDKLLVERLVEGYKEINCAAYRAKGRTVISECECPSRSGSILSFDDKYKSGLKHAKTREFPANITEEQAIKIKETTGLIYRKLCTVGVIRVDFLLAKEGVYVNEVNTVPGSLALYLFKDKVSQFSELLNVLIEEGVSAHRAYCSMLFSYRADVLGEIGQKNYGLKRSTNRP